MSKSITVSTGKLLPSKEIPEDILSQATRAMERAKYQLFSKYSNEVFFTSVMFSLYHKFTYEVPTAATDGKYILYNPEFFLSCNAEERVFIMLHETCHVAYMHIIRKHDKDHLLWNAACDYVINGMLSTAGFSVPAGALLERDYFGLSADEVYKLLEEKRDKQQADGKSTFIGIDGETTDGTSPDFDDLMPAGSYEKAKKGSGGSEGIDIPQPTQEELDEISEYINEVLVRAVTQANMEGKGIGNIPGEFARYVDKLLNPKLPWNQILRRYLSKFTKDDYSFRKLNRRFLPKYYLPSLSKESIGDIAVAIDVSGSVDDKQFHHFVSEAASIIKLAKPENLHLISFDHEIQQNEELKNLKDFKKVKFTGGGGTCIKPVIKWANKNKPKVLIFFTDGEFHMPEKPVNPDTQVIWLINDNPNFTAPYGKVITYEYGE
ncbi:Uncharacterized protein conserved in bacteria [Oligella urethralis]|uniref:vWA domain-containing protein n=1 Tax=Oligella urethralis TaxID=90245 RepID=UPI000DFEA5E1|nr:VWA-like domain-containing protein [Oligella urethralis]SUA63403.1 Uncharacterized protein conserved in bacteria [Oligella urethralis]